MRDTVAKALKAVPRNVPLLGIVAFATASVWALYQLFYNNALHPTPLYWIPAALVEFVTGWLVWQFVESVFVVTRSNVTKQDRRFNAILAFVCTALAVPTLWVSFKANRYEFQGDGWLASLFPVSCVACAFASKIPHTKTRKVDERLAQEKEKHAKTSDKLEEANATVARLEAELADGTQAAVKVLTRAERHAQLIDIWRKDGDKSFAEIAPMFKVSRQTISSDFAALRKAGKVKRNGKGVEVVTSITS